MGYVMARGLLVLLANGQGRSHLMQTTALAVVARKMTYVWVTFNRAFLTQCAARAFVNRAVGNLDETSRLVLLDLRVLLAAAETRHEGVVRLARNARLRHRFRGFHLAEDHGHNGRQTNEAETHHCCRSNQTEGKKLKERTATKELGQNQNVVGQNG